MLMMKQFAIILCMELQMASKWASIKSWWYWNISSKYDSLDVFVFVFFPLMVVGMIVLGYCGIVEKRELSAQCEVKGGVLVSTHKKYYCLNKEVVFDVRRD